MISTLRAELRKIYSIRSTYIVFVLTLLFTGMFALYGGGYKASVGALADPNYIADRVTLGINFISLILAFIGILSVTHEYRYNTILYTLTLSKSRLRVLVAKVFAVSGFAIALSLLFGALIVAGIHIGASLAGNSVGAQNIDIASVFSRVAFGGWAMSMYALVMAFIIRSQVGTIAAFLLLPTFLEQLLAVLIKDNQIYLPFSALNAVLTHSKDMSYGMAALVSGIYIIVGLLVSAILFVRRDAN